MPIKLALASFYTLGLLFGFLTAIVLLVMYFVGAIDLTLLLGTTVAINFVIWLVGPYFTDWIHRFFYKVEFLSHDVFRQTHPELESFIAQITTGSKIPFPKIGVIEDNNPTAYTYGSGAFNARIIFTKGLFTYLDNKEINAVIAHEIGHIVHRDFIVMSVANTIIQILYEISEIFIRSHSRRSGDRDNNNGSHFFVIGLIAYIFYIIGFYSVLFLNRMRETYADEFSAQVTKDPNSLSNALIKIAYGIMAKEETAQSLKLLESTRALGIMGFRTAKEAGLVAKVTNMEPTKVAKVFLYDLVSPWAKLAELSSTHPLTGKRIARLNKSAIVLGGQPLFNIQKVLKDNPVDKPRLWLGFFAGVFMYYLPLLTVIGLILIYVFSVSFDLILNYQTVTAVGIGIFGFSLILRAFYKYPSVSKAKNTDVLSLMNDIYATPAKGEPVALQGAIIGRGTPGYVFSEDMMFQDNSGLMYLDYQAGVPIIGNVVFAWKKLKQLFGQTMNVKGWFFRSNFQYVVLDSFQYNSTTIRSYAKFWNTIIGISLIGTSVIVGIVSNFRILFSLATIGVIIFISAYVILMKKNKILNPEEEARLAEISISWKRVFKTVGIAMVIILPIIILIAIFLR